MQRAVEMYAIVSFIIIGLSHVLRPRVWADFFAFLHGRGEAGVFAAAFMSLGFGSIIVAFHNVWSGLPMVLTIVGWAQVGKSLIYFTFPAYGLRKLEVPSQRGPQLFVVPGILFLILAGLLAYQLVTTTG